MGENYPTREKFYAMKFIRVLTKVCAAQEIGPTGFTLLSVIATTEDAAGYRRAVTYYDGQLAPTIGVNSQRALSNARAKCIEDGWLHYEPGCKGRAARYWVTVPEHAQGLDDNPTDEGHNDSPQMRIEKDIANVTNGHHKRLANVTIGNQIGDESVTIGNGKQQPFLPIPIPIPVPIPIPRADGVSDSENGISKPEPPSKTFLTSGDEQFREFYEIIPGWLRSGPEGIWNAYQERRFDLSTQSKASEMMAGMRLKERYRAYLASPKGRRKTKCWSAKTWLIEKHDLDDEEAWIIHDDETKSDNGVDEVLAILERNANGKTGNH